MPFERGTARWLLLMAAAGTVGAAIFHGLNAAGGFMVGAVGAWVNFRVIARAVEHLAAAAARPGGGTAAEKPDSGAGVWVFIQFAGLVLGAFVILRYSGFSIVSAFCGFLVCPAAVMAEMLFELVFPNLQK